MPRLPTAMHIMNSAETITESKGEIEISASGGTDFFVDPRNGRIRQNAPFYYHTLSGDFTARVWCRPAFRSTYDAGCLLVYGSASKWIKLGYEQTDLGYPSIVSVVTNGVSDDANGEPTETSDERADAVSGLRLQIARKGDLWALHHSRDGRRWKMVRYCRLVMRERIRVGLEAQAPIGKGCSVAFRGFSTKARAPLDMRRGR